MLYRRGSDRVAKYTAKFVPETVAARFTQVKDVAIARAQEGLTMWAAIQELIRPILDKYGVAGPMRAVYIGYANKLAKHAFRHAGDAGVKIAEALKAYYVTGFNADPRILTEINQVVIGYAIPY
jgi:hypothetical protein